MAYFAGLNVSLKETSVCIVDDAAAVDRMRSRLDTPLQRAQTSDTRCSGD
jgi:hypothetical protein